MTPGPSRFRNPLRDGAIVAAAGPLNFPDGGGRPGLAMDSRNLEPGRTEHRHDGADHRRGIESFYCIFNLLPIPPLDGIPLSRPIPLSIRYRPINLRAVERAHPVCCYWASDCGTLAQPIVGVIATLSCRADDVWWPVAEFYSFEAGAEAQEASH